MSNSILDSILNQWKTNRKIKVAPSGWMSGNAPCCVHNGETKDTKGRGGMLFSPDGGVVWHCFNCGYKTGWRPGLHFHLRIRKLMEWMGMDEGLIMRLQFDALRNLDEEIVYQRRIEEEIHFEPRDLPANTIDLSEAMHTHDDARDVANYIMERGFTFNDTNWLWSNEEGYNRRAIIPYTWQDKIIGYTARSIDFKKGKGKYIQHVGSDYVYGMDQQKKDSKFALIFEGTLDAIPLSGLAVLTNEISERKAEIIDTLGREIIVVPDKDKAGKHLVDAALRFNWSVAFPEWQEDIKDNAEACLCYGRLYSLRTILATKQSNKLKIELLRKRHGI